jgi:hypothetical protein
MGTDRGRGHTHDTRDRRKQAERNARKQEQKNKNVINTKMPIVPEDNTKQFIVCVHEKYLGGQTVNVIKENKQEEVVFIPGKCRMGNRRRQNVTNKTDGDEKYLIVEKIEIPIRTAGRSTYSLIHAYTKSELKELKEKKNRDELWYWKKWEDEYDDENKNQNNENVENESDSENETGSENKISDIDLNQI